MLTAGTRGKIAYCMALPLGLLVAAVAIFMTEKGFWSSDDADIWFPIAFIVVVPLYQYFCWRWYRFEIRQKEWTRSEKFLLAFLVLFIGWIIFVVWHDEALDPNFKQFYAVNSHSIPDNENVAVGLLGLDAPGGANFIDAGAVAFHNARANIYCCQQQNQADGQPKTKLSLVGTGDELNCWIWSGDSIQSSSDCASEKRLKEILLANAELLSRYWEISKLPRFQEFGGNLSLFLNLNKLIAADIELKIRHGEYDAAYKEWRANYQFIRRMLGEDSTWVTKAVLIVADSFSLESARSVVQMYPRIAAAHGDELVELFQAPDLSHWNIPGALRPEYRMFEPIISSEDTKFWGHKNFIRNRLLRSAQDFLKAADGPPSQLDKNMRSLWNDHGEIFSWSIDYLRDPINEFYVRAYLMSGLKAGELVGAMHTHDGQRRLLTLALKIKQQGLTAASVKAYLDGVGPELKNSFSGHPMKWVPEKNMIEFESPRYRENFAIKLFNFPS